MRRLSEYGSVADLVERSKRETRAEQYSDTVLKRLQTLHPQIQGVNLRPLNLGGMSLQGKEAGASLS